MPHDISADAAPRLRALALLNEGQSNQLPVCIDETNLFIDQLITLVEKAYAQYRQESNQANFTFLKEAIVICKSELKLHELWRTVLERCLRGPALEQDKEINDALAGSATHRDSLLIKVVFAEEHVNAKSTSWI